LISVKDLYALRPLRAAKVSEISETTAASPVPAEDRVNFHIGNPAQDSRLVSLFLRLALGQARTNDPCTETPEEVIASLGLEKEEQQRVEFLLQLIRKSAPYTPRGGFLRSNPQGLIRSFSDWLEKGQPDPLVYDLGEKSGIREVIMATGGMSEVFRVLFHALSAYLLHLPARIFIHQIQLPAHLADFTQIEVVSLPSDENAAMKEFVRALDATPETTPVFLGMGTILSEEHRRQLRAIASERLLVIVEANDAPNALSLAREARMSDRVIRILSAGVFDERFSSLPTLFLAGPPSFISIMEVAHFQLKGSPSAPEMEHLSALLAHPPANG